MRFACLLLLLTALVAHPCHASEPESDVVDLLACPKCMKKLHLCRCYDSPETKEMRDKQAELLEKAPDIVWNGIFIGSVKGIAGIAIPGAGDVILGGDAIAAAIRAYNEKLAEGGGPYAAFQAGLEGFLRTALPDFGAGALDLPDPLSGAASDAIKPAVDGLLNRVPQPVKDE